MVTQQVGGASFLREELAHLAELTSDHPWITIGGVRNPV
jgi:hypothetical protein